MFGRFCRQISVCFDNTLFLLITKTIYYGEI